MSELAEKIKEELFLNKILSDGHYFEHGERTLSTIQKAIDEHNQPSNNEKFEMINVKTILKYLGISRASLHNYERQGILKAYYLGSKKYYKRQEVLGAFEEKELLK